MKMCAFIFFIFISQQAFAQDYLFFGENKDWTPEDFKKIGIKKVSAYEFKVKSNGKIKKDSTLLYIQEYDAKENRVFGVNTSHIYYTHGPKATSLQKFERNYNSDEKIIRDFRTPVKTNPKKDKGFTTYEFNENENLFEYDGKGNILKETNISLEKKITLDKQNDTTYSAFSYEPRVYEYVYNDNNKPIKQYSFNDSTKTTLLTYIFQKERKTYKGCYGCNEKYKFQEKKYNTNGLLELSTSFTREGLIHSKTYFYYNNKLKIIREVDSTGWYLSSAKPHLSSETTYQYFPEKKIKTKVRFETGFNDQSKIVTVYNINGHILSECGSSNLEAENCEYYEYKYEGNLLVSILHNDILRNSTITSFKYNCNSQRAEEEKVVSGKTTNLIHYYYE